MCIAVELIYLGSKFDPAKRQKDLLHSMDSCCAFYLFRTYICDIYGIV